jgi:uncharacterized protein YkvS
MTLALVKGVLLGAVLLAGYGLGFTFYQLTVEPPLCEVPVVVEVQNGCGTPGIAEKVANDLRSEAFDVMLVENADDFDYPETIVVDRSGDRSKAWAVARALEVRDVITHTRTGDDFFVDVTVVIGSDIGGGGRL